MQPRLLRSPHTHAGFRVLHSNRCGPVVLPPPIVLTAEDIWSARSTALEEKYAEALAEIKCPVGARLVRLSPAGYPECDLYAIVDEDDFERVTMHTWQAHVRKGQKKTREHDTDDRFVIISILTATLRSRFSASTTAERR
jgi:hypothetical protein